MARRYQEIKGLAEFTAKTIVSSEEDWKKFLHTEGHMYKYRDAVDDREVNIAQTKADIESGNVSGIMEYLRDIVDQGDGTQEDIAMAKELIEKLAEYKPLARVEEREEQNYNMIDNVINNLPQNPEEKKEPAPQKEMRIAAFLAWLAVFFIFILDTVSKYIYNLF